MPNHTTDNHPCFQPQSRHSYARIHLPVAPLCNVQCRFCDRKFSCVNESRPGVTAQVMTPRQALEHLKRSRERVPNISVVGIAGPGDPFANAEETLETFRLVKESFPDLMLCVSTNGLNLMRHVNTLQALGVTHVTITVNAVDLGIGAEIYDWVRWNSEILRGREAARILWDNQELAIQALAFRDIVVKVNTVCIPGINSFHIDQISQTVAGLGASLHNVIPLLPTAHTPFAHLAEPSPAEMKAIRTTAQRYLPQMEHCSRCRADAVGLLGQKNEGEDRPYVAICTREGLEVDLHLGETETLQIYSTLGDGPVLVDVRKAPPAHGGPSRWVKLAEILKDCSRLLASGAGPLPRSVLTANGIQVRIIESSIAEALAQVEPSLEPEKPFACGAACGGDQFGCAEEE